jgi:dipeptidyl aminopeptidase/acylaminoacyl peptidase
MTKGFQNKLFRFARILAISLTSAASLLGQTGSPGVIVPGENLVTEGIPKIPETLARTVNRYTNAFGFRLAGWGPDKRELLFKNLAGTETWILRSESSSAFPKLSFVIPTGAYDVYWQPQAKYLVYNHDIDGNDSFQFYIFDVAARKSTLITDGKSRNTEPVWSRAGDRIIYSSSPPGGNGVDLSIVNPLDPKTVRLIAEGKGDYLKAYDWSPDDKRVVFCNFASNTNSTLWVLDVASGEKTVLSPAGAKGDDYYDSPQFGADGKGIYVLTDHGSEFRRLVYVDLATKGQKALSDQIKWDVEDFKLSPDGKSIAFITNEAGVSRLHLLDTKTTKETAVSSLPVGIISDLQWNRNSTDVAFNFRGPRTPNDVYSVDASTAKIEHWYKGTTGNVDLEKLPEPQRISWKSFDGQVISGFLQRPPTSFTGKRPIIINIHGGPEEQYRPEFGYFNNYLLSELGVALIFPNVRGSTGYGRSFHKLDDGALRVNAWKDIGALFDWVKSQADLDSDRIMIQGASYGGYMSLAVAEQYSERIRCALSDSGPSNLVTFLVNTAGWRRELQRIEFGDERDAKMREFLQQTAPLNSAGKIRKPLFIIQGQNDPRVPATEAQQMLAAVRKNGTPVWYLLAKDEGHDWSKNTNRNFRLYAISMFIQENLLKQAP